MPLPSELDHAATIIDRAIDEGGIFAVPLRACAVSWELRVAAMREAETVIDEADNDDEEEDVDGVAS